MGTIERAAVVCWMTNTGESDESLLGRYARGDAQAFEILYRRHEMRTWRYIERNVGNRATADELMQEVWFAVAANAARYEPTAQFTTWLFRIAHNRMIDSLRVRRPQMSLETIGYEADAVVQQLTTDPGVGPLAAVLARDQATALNQAIAQLPQEQREAFLLQIEGDLSVEEIAAITNSSFETTKSRLRYARAKLRQLLNEYA
jgi:RNA polymerase sigma factor (sigma-70 family)